MSLYRSDVLKQAYLEPPLSVSLRGIGTSLDDAQLQVRTGAREFAPASSSSNSLASEPRAPSTHRPPSPARLRNGGTRSCGARSLARVQPRRVEVKPHRRVPRFLPG